MARDHLPVQLEPYRWELAWGAWAFANLAWMELMPEWVSVPFHFIWVSFTVLYGFRAWGNALTWSLVGFVVVSTGIVLIQLWLEGMPTDEMLEVPLMFGMFLAMMLHTNRRKAAMAQVQRVSEQNMRMLEREREFVQNASHELRTPITVALAHAELMQLTSGDAERNEDVEIVIDELGRLRGLTDRLLLLAAAEGTHPVQQTPTNLAALVEAAVQRWSATPRTWRIGRRDDTTVLADGERLMVALDTLVENAIKVTEDGDVIELAVSRGDGVAVLAVSDSGPGIAPELLNSMFDRFATAGRRPDTPGGFGLGLAIVDAIAEAHGGSVTARNRPGGGATFAMRLPLTRGAGSSRDDNGRPPSSTAAPAPSPAGTLAAAYRAVIDRPRAASDPRPVAGSTKGTT